MSAELQTDVFPASPTPAELKSPTAYRTISEVADNLALPQHVLRFWESKFSQIKPLKRGGGRRYYRPEDVRFIHDIKELLYNQGYTIRGVQKLLRDHGATRLNPGAPYRLDPQAAQNAMDALAALHDEPPTVTPPSVTPPATPAATGLSPGKQRELQNLLGELKAMRKLLAQHGI